MKDTPAEVPARAYREALEGRFDEPAPQGSWVWPILALRSGFDRSVQLRPEALSNAPPRVVFLAVQHALLAHFVAGETEALDRWMEWLKAHAGPGGQALRTLAHAWRSLLRGGEGPDLTDVIAYARRANEASLLVDAMCASALLQLHRALDEATATARRAVHIARTEELVQQEYLANVTLASARRHEGRPYLAAKILGDLRRGACGRWSVWIEWEHQLADPFAPTDEARAAPLRAMRRGCETGDGSPLAQAPEGAACTADRHALTRLAELLRVGGTPFSPEEKRFRAWLTSSRPEEGFGHWIAVDARNASLEISAMSLGLADALGYTRCAMGSGQLRAAQVLAVLARAPHRALSSAAVFQRVYGFPYVPSKHSTVLRSALKRARVQLGGHGAIDRPSADTIRLVPHRPICVPEPASGLSLEEKILRVLSRTSASSAELARLVRVSKRQIQKALPALVAQGCCSSQKEGRTVRYNVEDTTFVVPTLARVQPTL